MPTPGRNISSYLKISALSALFFSAASFAETYEVSLTNLTAGQSFTPRLVLTHIGGQVFTPGSPAIAELVDIAEGGDIAPMMTLLAGFPEEVPAIATGDGLLAPGATQVVEIEGQPGQFLTLLAMLIPTNDGFIGANAVQLPQSGSVMLSLPVYDAGSETNDEVCANIPGPVCEGTAGSPADAGEGFIYVHSGIHGIADLQESDYDWKNPAARLVITVK